MMDRTSGQTTPALERDSKADEFDERDGLVADIPRRVAKAPTDLQHMAKKTWLFLSITTLLNIHNTIDGEVFMPYLYTRVHCCDTVVATLNPKYDEVVVSNGSIETVVPGCDVAARDVESPEWSHSPTCVNFAYVRNNAQEVRGVYGPLTTVLKVAVLPMAGFLADVYGRKKVLAISASGPLVAPLLWWIDSVVQPESNVLVYVAGLFLSVTAMGGPAQTAMLADLVTPPERAFCFPVLYAVQKGAPLVAQVIGVGALGLHLENYSGFWAVMFGTQIVIVAVLGLYLPETLPERKRRDRASWEWADISPIRHYVTAAQLVSKDWLLVAMCLWVCLTYVALGGFLSISFSFMVGDLNYLQEETLLPSIVGTLSAVVAASVAIKVLTRTGQWPGNAMGCYVVSLSYLIFGPGSVCCLGFYGPFIGVAMLEAGFGFTAPSYNTIVSWRVAQEDQGKAAATMAVMGNIGAIIGTSLYSFYLHDATMVGMDAARGFVASSAFMGIVALGATWTALREGCIDKPMGPRAYALLQRRSSRQDSKIGSP